MKGIPACVPEMMAMTHETIDESVIEKTYATLDMRNTDLCGRVLDIGGGGEGVIGLIGTDRVIAIDTSREELEEAPDGPIKAVIDAASLPFLDDSFDTVTLFFTWLYLPARTQETILRECRRVLRPGGVLRLWDTDIPSNPGKGKTAYAIMLEIAMKENVISTGYGVRWDKTQSLASVSALLRSCGFSVVHSDQDGPVFRLVATPACTNANE